jgi:hypothetical protein
MKDKIMEHSFLFLDDIRSPPQGYSVVRSYEEAIQFVTEHGCPDVISFDHDLGIGPNGIEYTGYHFALWLIEQDMSGVIIIPTDFSFIVHSANPIGKIKIESLLKKYLEFRSK